MWKETDMGKKREGKRGVALSLLLCHPPWWRFSDPHCFLSELFQQLPNWSPATILTPLHPLFPWQCDLSFVILWSNGFLWNSAMASPCLQNDIGTPACCSRISIEQFTSPGLLCATPTYTPKYSLLPSAGHAQHNSHLPRLPYICSCFFFLSLLLILHHHGFT